MTNPESLSAFCPLYHHAVELIGKRWSGAILRGLLADLHRFSELAQAVPDLSDRLLSDRLKEFETEGLVERRVFPDTPVRIEYHLTPKGQALLPVVEAVATWAEEWLAPEQLPSAAATA